MAHYFMDADDFIFENQLVGTSPLSSIVGVIENSNGPQKLIDVGNWKQDSYITDFI